MTAKEFVLNKYPKAKSEKHIRGRIMGMQETYWLIRNQGDTMYLESGKTEINAWVNTKKMIIESEKED